MARKIAYWTCTALVALVFLSGGLFQAIQNPGAMQGIMPLGYPVYFVVMLGVCKMAGAVAIAAPGLPRIKEWAYAGITFDLVAAVISHLVMHSELHHVIVPAVVAVLALVSWALRPAERRLADPPVEPVRAPALA